ncbi:MAG: hypothetical protein AAFR93_13245 [Pseudomonadota bacterium]
MGTCRSVLPRPVCAILLVGVLSACGGGGGGSDDAQNGINTGGSLGAGAEPRPTYASFAAEIPDTGAFLHLGNSALWGETLPLRLAGVQVSGGVVEGVRGGADVTLVNSTTLDVQLGGEIVRFTYNAQTFRFEDGTGRWFNTPQPPFAFTLNGGEGLFHLVGGFAPSTLPGGLVRYTGTSEVMVIPQGATSLGAVETAAGQMDISVDFANGLFAGEGFRGQVDLGAGAAQDVTIAVDGSLSADRLTGQVTGITELTGVLQVDVLSSDLTGQVLENDAAKLVGDFGVDFQTHGAASETGTVIGAFRGFK